MLTACKKLVYAFAAEPDGCTYEMYKSILNLLGTVGVAGGEFSKATRRECPEGESELLGTCIGRQPGFGSQPATWNPKCRWFLDDPDAAWEKVISETEKGTGVPVDLDSED